MENAGLKVNITPPSKLEPHQEWICNYLDRLNEKQRLCPEGVLPSDLIRGALAAVSNKDSNPDWIAQSAHSYREILYGLNIGPKNKTTKTKPTKAEMIGEVMQILHERDRALKIARVLNYAHQAFSNISHHFSKKNSKKQTIKIFGKLGIVVDKNHFPQENDFLGLIRVFENTIKESSLDPLKIHEKIDTFLKGNNDASYLRLLFSLSYDAKRYYFSQANETNLEWIWTEGFLDEIKKKAENTTSYSYRLPELEYLTRMTEKNPAKVVEIIASVKISEATFNPEVIDRFMWITGSLPVEQMKTLTAKIRNEKWVYLMRAFRKSGYEFERIIKKLVEKKESNALLELARAIFAIKSKTEISEKDTFSMDDPFYVSDLDASGIFEALADIDEAMTEQALQVTTGVMAEIIKLGKPDEDRIFDYEDQFALYDVDFFTPEVGNKRSASYREDVKNLAATIKKLIEKTIGKKCGDTKEVKRLFEYVDKLPSCRSMWRLRLFALSQCPDVFKDELKIAFFKVFEVGERYFEIEGGAEYHQLLIRCFGVLDENTKREYVKKVFEYFGADLEDKDKEKWRKRDGLKILSFINENLTPHEKERVREKFDHSLGEINFTPEPSIGQMRGGSVNHKSPVDIGSFSVEQIIANLKSEWTQEKLAEQFKNDDFLNPRGVEGLGDAIKEDVKKRTDDYLNKITSFFERDAVHPAYVYSLLRGIEEMLRNKQTLTLEQVGQLFKLFDLIKDSGRNTAFRRKDDKSWLADWIEVHKVMTDILLFVLEDKEKRTEINKQYRDQIKDLISYLFTIKDSPSKDHEEPEYGEPYHIAINSVRGRAYEAFVVFTENDGKALADDTKTLYKEALADDSLAVRFVIGRYLASFYFRDKDFITELLPAIFPKDDPNKKDVYLASWEGYLSNTLYDKLFTAFHDYYSHAITLDPKNYTKRKYSKGLDESLAIHIALAFAHLGPEINDPLFVQFWDMPNVKRHQEFISFIGRSCLTRDQAGDEWLAENKVSKEKLLKFWDWALEHVTEPEALAGFGFWVNPNKEVLDDTAVIERMAQTLKKSGGDVDWDYGLMRRLPIFAEKNGDKVLAIISNFLLDSEGNLNQNRRAPLFSIDGEIKQSFDVIYKNANLATKQKVVDLINSLIEKGSSTFWGLKEVIKA